MSYPYYFLVEALKLHFKTAANPSFSYRFIYHADLFLWPPGPVCVPHADLFHLNGQMVGLRLVWYTIMPLCSQSRHFDWYYCDSHVCFCLFFVSTHLHYFKGWVLPQLQLERLELYCSWFSERLVWGKMRNTLVRKGKRVSIFKKYPYSSTQNKDGNIKCKQDLLGKCKNKISTKCFLWLKKFKLD